MYTPARILARLSFVFGLLVCSGFALASRPTASSAAAVHVSSFYTITKSSFDAWKSGAAAPAAATKFPAGTANIAYYFAYSGAKANSTTFQVVQKDPDGTVVKGEVHKLTSANGVFLNYFYRNPAFAPGTYTFELHLNKLIATTTSFSIKKGIVIPDFYPISKTSFDTWTKSTSDAAPAKTTVFPSGTKNIGYYFSYAGTTPKVTSFRIVINDSSGKALIKGDLHKVSYNTGFFANYFYNDPSFPSGSYSMQIYINEALVKTSTFVVS